MSFYVDVLEGKEVEIEVLKLMKVGGRVSQGYFPDFDILIDKPNSNNELQSYTVEVKYHRCPEKYIPYEVFDYKKLLPIGISISRTYYWVDVISEKDNWNKKTVWLNSTTQLRDSIKDWLCKGDAITSKKESDGNIYGLVNIPIGSIKELGTYLGEFYKC
jgi:hypothetical protein